MLALRIERSLEKDEILNLYLNEIPYGGTYYGIEEASMGYFGKSAEDLSAAEAAYLAALPQAPTFYSPFGNNRDALDARQRTVLERMREMDFLTDEEYEKAKNEDVSFVKQENGNIKAPHFVMSVREELADRFGEEALTKDGLRVVTTLDWELQSKAEEIVNEFALQNETRFNAKNGAMIAIKPNTGEVITMVGSRDYFDEEIDGNFNAATSENRQPGSTFKPFAYAQAFRNGYTPETILFDLATQFSVPCGPNDLTSSNNCYSPRNYDNEFRGPITMRNALAQSVNIPAVKATYIAGLDRTLTLARDMGVQSLDTNADRYGLSLALGGGEVSLIDMVSAYGTFANDGERRPYVLLKKVTDRDGEVLFDLEEELEEKDGEQVLEEQVARQINDVLSDNNARTPAFGPNSPLHYPNYDVAAKTGTTNDYRDAWIIGYTPEVAVGAWAGNNDNSPMAKQIAGFIVAPMWNAVMKLALEEYAEDSFPEPEPLSPELKPVLRGVWNMSSTNTQQVNNEDTENSDSETTEAEQPTLQINTPSRAHSILYWTDPDDPQGPVPANPASDPQFSLWETPVRNWSNGFAPPSTTEDRRDRRGQFLQPSTTTTYRRGDIIPFAVLFQNGVEVDSVTFGANGAEFSEMRREPFVASLNGDDDLINRGENTASAYVQFSDGTTATFTTQFTRR